MWRDLVPYVFHALSAHAEVADVSVISPSPANVTVTILAKKGDGQASEAVLNAVTKKLNDENIRPIADRVTVQSASIHRYQIHAKLHIYRGREYEPINKQAQEKSKIHRRQTTTRTRYYLIRYLCVLAYWKGATWNYYNLNPILYYRIIKPAFVKKLHLNW